MTEDFSSTSVTPALTSARGREISRCCPPMVIVVFRYHSCVGRNPQSVFRSVGVSLLPLTLRPARMHVSNQQVSHVFQSHCILDGMFGLKKSTEQSEVNCCPTSVDLALRRNACLCPATGIHHQSCSMIFHLWAGARIGNLIRFAGEIFSALARVAISEMVNSRCPRSMR